MLAKWRVGGGAQSPADWRISDLGGSPLGPGTCAAGGVPRSGVERHRPGTTNATDARTLAAATSSFFAGLPRNRSIAIRSPAVSAATLGAAHMARQWPIQKDGGSSEAVRTVQYLLRARANSLAVDGIVGAGTWFALVSAG